MNNNIIPACIIGAGLFAVALKPAPQPHPERAEPAAVATASVTGQLAGDCLVWNYGTPQSENSTDQPAVITRAWSDGVIETMTLSRGI